MQSAAWLDWQHAELPKSKQGPCSLAGWLGSMHSIVIDQMARIGSVQAGHLWLRSESSKATAHDRCLASSRFDHTSRADSANTQQAADSLSEI